MSFLCAGCGETTTSEPCSACGANPLVDGRYALLDVLGSGGVGTTYRALHRPDGKIVALKEAPYRRATDLKMLELFEREAKVLRELSHPAIPKYLDHFVFGQGRHRALYLAQELITGKTLEEDIEKKRGNEASVRATLVQVLDVLEYLHGLAPPVIHRDIKPSNLMRASDGSIRVLDFGSVRDVIKDPRLGGSTVTGTYGYMAPEQFQGIATAATDLFALGVTALVMLTREAPQELFDPLGRGRWTERVSISPAFKQLLEHLVARDPDDRLGSAREVKRILLDIDAGRDPFPRRLPEQRLPPKPPPPPPEAHARTLARFGLIGAALTAVLGVLLPGAADVPIALGAPALAAGLAGWIDLSRRRTSRSRA
ncbi:MAG: serine/threonine protein kinase [Deltaproteobacteria bacterium]|nr:serine/threonine protein kinase [Deltaproteobacteria bacterium]